MKSDVYIRKEYEVLDRPAWVVRCRRSRHYLASIEWSPAQDRYCAYLSGVKTFGPELLRRIAAFCERKTREARA